MWHSTEGNTTKTEKGHYLCELLHGWMMNAGYSCYLALSFAVIFEFDCLRLPPNPCIGCFLIRVLSREVWRLKLPYPQVRALPKFLKMFHELEMEQQLEEFWDCPGAS